MDLEIEIPSDGLLALDRRTFDADGRLVVTGCTLTAAQVNPYLGKEVPDFDKLGLDPEAVYQFYRDPQALRDAVPLFEGQPLMIDHVAVSAAEPHQQMIVGTVRDCEWRDGKVIGTLNVWDAGAIRDIETNARRDLSVGYYYRPVMKAGTAPSGEAFDGRMVDLRPNHVALVSQGRVAGAMVADAALRRRRAERVVTVDTATALRIAAEQRSRAHPLEHLIPGIGRLR